MKFKRYGVLGLLIIGAIYINYKLIVNRPRTAVKTVVKIKKVLVVTKILVPASAFDRAKMTNFIAKENPAISPAIRKIIVASAVKYGRKYGVNPFVITLIADVDKYKGLDA